MKKWPGIFVVIAVIIAGIVAKDVIARMAIVKGVKALTGVGLKLEKSEISLFQQTFRLRGLEILNPGNFSDRVMADFPEISAGFDLAEFFKGGVRLRELTVDLKQFFVIISQDGTVNVKSLNAFLPKGKGKPPKVQIDELNLKIGRVVLKDYSKTQASEKEFNINLNEKIKNISGPDALVKLILVKSLAKTGIPSVAKIDLSSFKKEILSEIDKRIEAVGAGIKNLLPSKEDLK